MKRSGFGKSARRVALGGLVALGSACATMQGAQQAKVDDQTVNSLPPGARTQVDAQQREVGQAQQRVDQLQAQKKEMDARVTVARREQEVAEARYNLAQAEQKLQQQLTQGQQEQERQRQADQDPRIQQARLERDAAKAQVDYLQAMTEVSDGEIAWHEKQVELARARLEQAKFEAVRQNRPDAIKDPQARAPQLERDVAKAQASVADARATLAQARTNAVQKHETWTGFLQQLPDGERRAQGVPPPPRG
jgi:chromosome segregation ATPase